MWEANGHGGGVAWRADGLVHWKKGLDLNEMLALNRTMPLPYVMHFRIPSGDTSKSQLVCHPFIVSNECPADAYEGTTTDYVLFHNGHWASWKHKVEELARTNQVAKLPTGPWSDSRALAWYSSHLGLGILEFIDEKVICFGPNPLDEELFGKWSVYKPNEGKSGYVVSNEGWVARARHVAQPTVATLPAIITQPSITELAHKAITVNADEQAGGTVHNGRFPNLGKYYGPAAQARQEVRAEAAVTQSVQETEKGAAESKPMTIGVVAACHYCHARKVGRPYGNIENVCWQCWSIEVAKSDDFNCHLCKTVKTYSIRLDNGLPICSTCAQTNGPILTSYRGALGNVETRH